MVPELTAWPSHCAHQNTSWWGGRGKGREGGREGGRKGREGGREECWLNILYPLPSATKSVC